MAPELLKGGGASASLTDKVDIYALGIMLWELAARQLPWKGCSDVQVQALVRRATPAAPSLLRPAPPLRPRGGRDRSGSSTFTPVPRWVLRPRR